MKETVNYRNRGGEWRGCIAATSHIYMVRFSVKQMRIYLDPQAQDYYSSKVNVDTYTFELYKPSISVDGQRTWEIQRYLLDENLKRQLDKVYEEQNDDVLSSILNLLQEKGKGFMTSEDALKML